MKTSDHHLTDTEPLFLLDTFQQRCYVLVISVCPTNRKHTQHSVSTSVFVRVHVWNLEWTVFFFLQKCLYFEKIRQSCSVCTLSGRYLEFLVAATILLWNPWSVLADSFTAASYVLLCSCFCLTTWPSAGHRLLLHSCSTNAVWAQCI